MTKSSSSDELPGARTIENTDKYSSNSFTTPEERQKQANASPEKYDPLKEQKESQSANLPATGISFTEYEHDFGVLNEGDSPEHVFTFTNSGSEPLILEKCKGSCGCTVPTCPKEPIPPGGTGEIKVRFNSKNKKNKQTKKVTVTANTDPVQTILTIKADVIPAPEEANG
ncbi:MAG: DUF1573 domain-containing protein [Flavobacteriales bacterium]|nr:DUF1573 domain-containing protein [Flavobacteriales bacterium]